MVKLLNCRSVDAFRMIIWCAVMLTFLWNPAFLENRICIILPPTAHIYWLKPPFYLAVYLINFFYTLWVNVLLIFRYSNCWWLLRRLVLKQKLNVLEWNCRGCWESTWFAFCCYLSFYCFHLFLCIWVTLAYCAILVTDICTVQPAQ